MMGERGGPGPKDVESPATAPEARSGTARMELLKRKKEILAMGDITPADREILDQPLFKLGEEVVVERKSSGKFEGKWFVTNPNVGPDTEGRVLVAVIKEEGRTVTVAMKQIPEEELARYNP